MVDARSSDIAHRGLAICNPISSATLDRVLMRSALPPGALAVDVGCGKGELLLRLASRYDVSALGLDISQGRVDEATATARARGLAGRVAFRCQDAKQFVPASSGYSLSSCVGSTHALGGLAPTLATLRAWTHPGGWIVVGEGFWMRDPDPEYLAVLGADKDEFGGRTWIEETARDAGLDPVEEWVCSAKEWQDYEDALLRGIESYVRSTPADSAGPRMLAEQREFHGAQVRWGRSTLGFAVHLLRRPG